MPYICFDGKTALKILTSYVLLEFKSNQVREAWERMHAHKDSVSCPPLQPLQCPSAPAHASISDHLLTSCETSVNTLSSPSSGTSTRSS